VADDCSNKIRIGESCIDVKDTVKNLGCLLNQNLCMEKHVQDVCRKCYLSLYHISQIRTNLTEKTTAILVNSLILSKLNYMNCF